MGRNSVPPTIEAAPLGRKGKETRLRLLETACALFDTIPLRDIRAADISRQAGMSVGAFYVYFENVEAIALELADQVAAESASLIKLVDVDWNPPHATRSIRAFVTAYFKFWDDHRPVLRVRNLASEEGDQRFLRTRLAMSVPLHRGLAAKIAQGRERGLIVGRENEMALAAMVIGGIDRVASFSNYVDYTEYGVSQDALISAATRFIKIATVGENAL